MPLSGLARGTGRISSINSSNKRNYPYTGNVINRRMLFNFPVRKNQISTIINLIFRFVAAADADELKNDEFLNNLATFFNMLPLNARQNVFNALIQNNTIIPNETKQFLQDNKDFINVKFEKGSLIINVQINERGAEWMGLEPEKAKGFIAYFILQPESTLINETQYRIENLQGTEIGFDDGPGKDNAIKMIEAAKTSLGGLLGKIRDIDQFTGILSAPQITNFKDKRSTIAPSMPPDAIADVVDDINNDLSTAFGNWIDTNLLNVFALTQADGTTPHTVSSIPNADLETWQDNITAWNNAFSNGANL